MEKAETSHTPPIQTGRLLDVDFVLTDLGFDARSTLYRLIAKGEYPQPLKIGRNSRWRAEDHEAYKASLQPGKALAPRSPGRPRKEAAPAPPTPPSPVRKKSGHRAAA